MNVIEFIREKTENIQQNNAEFIAKLEPKFRNLSHMLNDKIANTLNNPWISRFNPFEDDSTDNEQDLVVSLAAENTYRELKNKLGQETFLGDWHTVDQNCINKFADITGI